MITDEDKEKVRQAVDFVQLVGETVDLRQRGQEFWGCCPFHGEKSPSFKVNPATGLWHCFGCGEGGDVFSYVQKREHLDFPDAIRYLADRAGIELTEERGRSRGPKKNRLMEALGDAEAFYSTMLMRGRGEGPDSARKYFASRGFGADVCRRWGLGYAPGRGSLVKELRSKGFSLAEIEAADLAMVRRGRPQDRFFDRVMFPIHDEMGRTIAFGGRVIGPKKDTAKYVNTRDTQVFNKGKHLFAYDRAKETMAATGEAIVCEGYTDVISMHEHGFTNAVAALGTAFRIDHVRLMDRQRVNRIICMFDGDAAGQRAAERAVQFLPQTKADMRCVVLPDNMDPMEFLVARPAEEMRAQLDAAVPLMSFVFEKNLEGVNLGVAGEKTAFYQNMLKVLAPLKESVLVSEYAGPLAGIVGTPIDRVVADIKATPITSFEEPGRARRSGSSASGGRSGYARASSQTTRRGASPAGGATAYVPDAAYGSAPGYSASEDEPVYDYAPPEAYEEAGSAAPMQAPASVRAPLTTGPVDARRLDAERELLCAMASHIDHVRPYADRIADFHWADARHESLAWAMLSTPVGATPAQVVEAARAVEPAADEILSGGRVISAEDKDMGIQARVELLVDDVDIRSSLAYASQLVGFASVTSGEKGDELCRQAVELQKRAARLEQKRAHSDDTDE